MSARLQDLYGRAPRRVQDVAVSARGLALRRSRLGPGFRRALAAGERTNASAARTEAVQAQRLDTLLRLLPGSSATSADPARERLAREPVMTKADVVADPARYELPCDERVVTASTGGSTGSPLRFRTTQSALDEQWAVWWRYRRWHGIGLDTWCGQFSAQPICPPDEARHFWRYNLPGRQVQFSYHHLTEETAARYVEEINRRRLRWFHGHPSTIGLLAAHMAAADLRLTHEVRWVTLCCENVAESIPPLVASVFGAPVRQHYGLAEGVANLSECPAGRLHVDEDFAVVELLAHDGEGAAGPLRRVVGTALTNHAQAFVRYDTGDLVSGVEDGCGCGRPGRTVTAIDGRTASFAVLPSGERIGPVNQVFDGLPGVVQGQVFVRPSGRLTYHLVVGAGYSPEVAGEIEARTRARARQDVAVDVEVRGALTRGANGKVPVVVQGDPPS